MTTKKTSYTIKKNDSFFSQAESLVAELLHPDFEERLQKMFKQNKFNQNQEILFRYCLSQQFELNVTVEFLKSRSNGKV